jgi:hypothetical protein
MEPTSLRFGMLSAPPLAAWVVAGVLIVHPTQPGAFPDIQSACDAAKERDTILVKSGTYPTFEVDDKWLTIAADSPGNVTVNGGARVRNLDAGKRLTLIGLTLNGTNVGIPEKRNALDGVANQGALRLDNCILNGAPFVFSVLPNGGDALRVEACADVAISRSELRGGPGAHGYLFAPTSPGRGGAGVHAVASSVVLHDTSVRGGHGQQGSNAAWSIDGGDGGHGCLATASVLFASRSSFTGGHGGNGYEQWAKTYGGAGGDGVRLEGSKNLLRRISTTFSIGLGGQSYGGLIPPPAGASGVAFRGLPTELVDLVPAGRSMSVRQNPIRESTSAALALTGQPGDRVGIFISLQAGSSFNPAWSGQQLFPHFPAPAFIDAGVVPGSGLLSFSLPFPDLGPGVDARTFLIQPAFSSATHRLVLGTPIPLLVLDSAY